jgi:biotin carboxyl carrier protein
MRYVTKVGEHSFEIEIEEPGEIVLDGRARQVDLQEIVPGRHYSLLLNHVSNQSFVEGGQGGQFQVLLKGQLYQVEVRDERSVRLARGPAGFVPDSGEIGIQAPMPGLIVKAPVTAGELVREGEVLIILESMKMDNELCAPRDGTVARVHVEEGDSVEGGQVLVTLG